MSASVRICIVLNVMCLFVISMCVSRLRQPPQTLAELDERLKLLEALQCDLAKTEAQIPLIHDQFSILDKYEVPVEQAVSTLLINEQIHTYLQCTQYRTVYEQYITNCDFTLMCAPL